MRKVEVRAFLGDAERTFAFSYDDIRTLERLTGVGIGALVKRVQTMGFSYGDLVAIIRVGLIGAGVSTGKAEEILQLWVYGRPVAEVLPVALTVINGLFFGPDEPAQVETVEDAMAQDETAMEVALG